jgi:hypothetical protein
MTAACFLTVGCNSTTKHYHYEEDTVHSGDEKIVPEEGGRRPGHTDTDTHASDPKIIVE